MRPALSRPCSASQATPAKPPLSSSTVPLISTEPVQLDAGAADAFGREQRRGDPRLHVARSAAVDPAVLDVAAERIARPAVAGGDDVEVPVQVHDRLRAASGPGADDVDAGMAGGVLGTAFGGEVLDVESATRRAGRRSGVRSPRTPRRAD